MLNSTDQKLSNSDHSKKISDRTLGLIEKKGHSNLVLSILKKIWIEPKVLAKKEGISFMRETACVITGFLLGAMCTGGLFMYWALFGTY